MGYCFFPPFDACFYLYSHFYASGFGGEVLTPRGLTDSQEKETTAVETSVIAQAPIEKR